VEDLHKIMPVTLVIRVLPYASIQINKTKMSWSIRHL
jgi:hypothetical protein